MKSLALVLYRAAWEPALALLHAFAAFERLAPGLAPPRWRARERLETPRLPVGAGPGATGARSRPRLWLHAASLGECKGLWAFARTLSDLPCDFVLTATTVEGRDFLRARAGASGEPERWIARLAPADHPRVVRRFLEACDVRGTVLFEVELWPHFIRESRRRAAPVFWVSARLTPRAAARYGRFPAATRALLRSLAWTQAHGAREAAALRAMGCREVAVGGDLRGLLYLDAGLDATVAASSREGFAFVSFHADELEALKVLAATSEEPLYVLPRRREEFARFAAALAPLGFEPASRNPAARRLLIDAFGRTGEILARARAAVVGGSFADHGGHNVWEPLVAGIPAAIGPWRESQEYLAARLEALGLLRVIKSEPTEGVETLFPLDFSPETQAEAARARALLAGELRAAAAEARAEIKRRVSFAEAR